MRFVFATLCLVACNKAAPTPAPSKLEPLRDALISESASAFGSVKTCQDVPYTAKKGAFSDDCLNDMARGLGSPSGLVVTPPDEYASATAAVLIARDGRGDALMHVDTWLNTIKTAKGAGHDALRVAVAQKMAAAAPAVGRTFEDEESSRAAIKAIVSAVPGACVTYWLVGNHARAETMPEPLTPDHSPCVAHDLGRDTIAAYGHGVPRTLEAALQLWRAAEKALREGESQSDAKSKSAIDGKLSIIADATAKIKTKPDIGAALDEVAAKIKDGGAPDAAR